MVKNERISDARLAEMLESMAQYGHMEHASLGFPIFEMKLMVAELAALRAANSDGGVEVEPVAWVPVGANGQTFWLEIQTRMEHFAGHWAADGYSFKPLFTQPPAKALDGITVTEEVLDCVADRLYGTKGFDGRVVSMSKEEARKTALLALGTALAVR